MENHRDIINYVTKNRDISEKNNKEKPSRYGYLTKLIFIDHSGRSQSKILCNVIRSFGVLNVRSSFLIVLPRLCSSDP